MAMYKAIIFDFFDVMAPDFYRVWLEKNGYERRGEFLKLAQEIDNGQINLKEYYSRLSSTSGQSAASLQDQFENKTRLDLNIIKLISTLGVNYKVGLLTNSPSNLVRLILQKSNLEKLFDDIVISAEVGCVKPNHQIFELALERLKIHASEAVFIDDLQPYVEGAEAVGIASIRFDNIHQLEIELKKLGLIIDKPLV